MMAGYVWPKYCSAVLWKKLEMLPDANIDDYVLVHVGVAISKVDEEEAQKTFKYLEEIGELGDLTDVDEYLPKTN